MKTTLITLLAFLALVALLLPARLANSEVYKNLSGISISYKIGSQQNTTEIKDTDESFLDENYESALNSFDDKLSMDDWMTDLSEWKIVK
jgi:hypothetical protein